MLTLVGSRAMKHWYSDARDLTAKSDWDWFATEIPGRDCFLDDTRNDIFVNDKLSQWDFGSIATVDELYTIKISHSMFIIDRSNQTWDKHMADIIFLSRQGARFLRPLYDLLQPLWKDKHNKKKTDLTQSKADFFDDAVTRIYDHDSIHETVKYGNRPGYFSVLKEGSEVECDWNKFDNLPHIEKLEICLEEIYTTALERVLIPDGYKGSPRAAYHLGLRKTCTSLFRGEWALFCLLNLDELRRPDVDYLQRHLDNQHLLIKL